MQVQVTAEGRTFAELEAALEAAVSDFAGEGTTVEVYMGGQAQITQDGRSVYRISQTYEVAHVAPVALDGAATADTPE